MTRAGRSLLFTAALCLALACQPVFPESNRVAPVRGIPGVDANAVRASIDEALTTLTSISIGESISRFEGKDGTTRKLDSFETEVSIADGVEQYSEVRGAGRNYRHLSDIQGLWSYGEIVTMLRTTRDLMDSAVAEPEAARTVIRFHCPAGKHQWFLKVAGRVYWLDFEGTVKMSEQTGEIERLTWTVNEGPREAGIASILWDVNFHGTTVAGVSGLMPSDSEFRIVRRGSEGKAEWNLTRYAALGRYGSQVNVSFGQ
jgi:hypothetical protein